MATFGTNFLKIGRLPSIATSGHTGTYLGSFNGHFGFVSFVTFTKQLFYIFHLYHFNMSIYFQFVFISLPTFIMLYFFLQAYTSSILLFWCSFFVYFSLPTHIMFYFFLQTHTSSILLLWCSFFVYFSLPTHIMLYFFLQTHTSSILLLWCSFFVYFSLLTYITLYFYLQAHTFFCSDVLPLFIFVLWPHLFLSWFYLTVQLCLLPVCLFLSSTTLWHSVTKRLIIFQ